MEPMLNTQKKSITRRTQHRGFALLVAIVFTSVMLALGLALSSLAYKQEVLASSAIESQYAFYAADTALECALYADQQTNLFAYQAPGSVAPVLSCSGQNGSANVVAWKTIPTTEWVTFNRLSLASNTRCADVTVYKPSSLGTTTIFAQGYDVPCSVVATPNGTQFVSRGLAAQY